MPSFAFMSKTFSTLLLITLNPLSFIYSTHFWQQPQVADFQTVNVDSDENAGLKADHRNAIGMSK